MAIRSCAWSPAMSGRLECSMLFTYEKKWNGRYYKSKKIRPIFIEREDEIVVISVYTYFTK